MEVKNLQEEVAYNTEVLEALQSAIRDLRRRIEEITRQARSLEDIDPKAVSQGLKDIQALIPQCAKAENTLNESRNKQAGIARGHHALDLDRARAEIGCKLDRLRRCGPPTTVS
ncbi:hypothetical protein [Sulfitobacter sp. THAF37]|uniref:hypothetical protein n=1 Tax=Sulfitobacter sp. THAF37 TaxID=2587855 RepID=UPI0012680BA8|nr:hypothetical protein [Sulfitobacter sp. THAF37]